MPRPSVSSILSAGDFALTGVMAINLPRGGHLQRKKIASVIRRRVRLIERHGR